MKTDSAVSACTSTIQITPCGESQKYASRPVWLVIRKMMKSTAARPPHVSTAV